MRHRISRRQSQYAIETHKAKARNEELRRNTLGMAVGSLSPSTNGTNATNAIPPAQLPKRVSTKLAIGPGAGIAAMGNVNQVGEMEKRKSEKLEGIQKDIETKPDSNDNDLPRASLILAAIGKEQGIAAFDSDDDDITKGNALFGQNLQDGQLALDFEQENIINEMQNELDSGGDDSDAPQAFNTIGAQEVGEM